MLLIAHSGEVTITLQSTVGGVFFYCLLELRSGMADSMFEC